AALRLPCQILTDRLSLLRLAPDEIGIGLAYERGIARASELQVGGRLVAPGHRGAVFLLGDITGGDERLQPVELGLRLLQEALAHLDFPGGFLRGERRRRVHESRELALGSVRGGLLLLELFGFFQAESLNGQTRLVRFTGELLGPRARRFELLLKRRGIEL